MAYYDGVTDADIPDNISLAATDTSTSASLFTRYTGRTGTLNTQTSRRTSKNRRREERKRARGKKGSVYEEEYLVNSIRRLIDRVNSVRDEINRLAEALLRRRMWTSATAVEKAMCDLVELCKACLDEVFRPPVSRHHGVEGSGGNDLDDLDDGQRPAGAQGVLFDSLKEAGAPKDVPLVMPFERLTLLGS